MDEFQHLPNNRKWQDTIHFNDGGHRCPILKRWVPSFTYFLRYIFRDFREPPQRGHHIQLMELPISSICWLSDYHLDCYLFCCLWPDFIHFKSVFDGIKRDNWSTQLVESDQQSSQPPSTLQDQPWVAILVLLTRSQPFEARF